MENNNELLDSFCDFLTDELVPFEANQKILAKSFHTNINLIETIAVTLIISVKKVRFNEYNDILNRQQNHIGWRDYFISSKLFIKSLLILAVSHFKVKPKQHKVCFFEYYPHNLKITESIMNVAPNGTGFVCVSLRDKVFKRIKKQYPIARSQDFGLIDIISVFKINKAANIFVDSFFSRIVDVNKEFLVFKPVLLRILKRELLNVTKFISQYERMINRLRPKKAVFTTDSVPFARLIIQLCKTQEITTVTIQHGLMPNSRLLKLMITENYFVWGPYYKELIESHNKDVRLHVVGSLKHSEIIMKYSGIKKDPRKILYATSPPSGTSIFLNDYQRVFREIWSAAKELPQYDFLIKLHPSEKAEVIKDLLSKFGELNNISLLSSSEDVYFHVATSRLVLFVSSTVSLESLLLNTPVICLNFNFFENLLPFQNVYGYYEVKTEGKLSGLIESVLEEADILDLRTYRIAEYCLDVFNYNEAINKIF